ncbi:chemotaxis protein CheY [Legionella norrlandica]|uniref:Chemotaxis protein CheY n=1 Tax=Legionella norrlandica TaxID=1498499 RepID=A0A0A2SN68_9GAMM|nr:response regulator [Legionella norrlandica]KGP62575.1 chemotaxis protein CheY [Legionella norrlandica]
MHAETEECTHVLLVDDDEVDLMSVQREIAKLGIPVCFHIAHDGVEALKELVGNITAHKPEVIILDIMMPKMNGIEFLRELRSYVEYESIQVVILTTSSNIRDKQATFGLDIAGYFVKDTQFDEFVYCCKHLLEKNPRLM